MRISLLRLDYVCILSIMRTVQTCRLFPFTSLTSCHPAEGIPRSSTPQKEKRQIYDTVVDETQMRHTPRTTLQRDDEPCNITHHASPVTHSSFPHHPHHRRLSPRAAPHPGIGAKMLRYQVSYPLPFMQPHLTSYLSRHENGAEREGKGMHPGEYPCQLIQLTECNYHVTQVSERHPGPQTPRKRPGHTAQPREYPPPVR